MVLRVVQTNALFQKVSPRDEFSLREQHDALRIVRLGEEDWVLRAVGNTDALLGEFKPSGYIASKTIRQTQAKQH